MDAPNLNALLPGVEKIARLAGTEVMKYFGNVHIYTKQDGSKVTDADLAAEAIILPALRALAPHIPIVSEERVAEGDVPDISGGTFWTVDPIDGTREFIEKNDGFVVAIALIVAHKPALGLIYHPSLNVMFTAHGPGTAVMTGPDGTKTPLPAEETAPGQKWRVLINGWWSDMEQVDTYLARHCPPDIERETANEGIFRACRVAMGDGDLTVVYGKRPGGRIAFWDVAPGHAIVSSAGGRVETYDGAPLLYDSKDLYVGPHVMISPRRAKTFR